MTAGKVYRNDGPSSTRLQVFHQLELLVLAESSALDAWTFVGAAMKAVDAMLPGWRSGYARRTIRYARGPGSWEWKRTGALVEIAGGGVYGPEIVRFLGGDPEPQTACGLAFGLERVADEVRIRRFTKTRRGANIGMPPA